MHTRQASFAICNILAYIAAAVMTIIGPMLSEIGNEFSLTVAQSGLLYAAEFTGFTVFILLGGVAADRLGKRAVITAVLAVLAVSLIAFSLSTGFAMSLVVILFAGGLGGPLESVALSVVSDLYPENSVKYVNISSVFYGLGGMTGPVAAGICISNDVSWRTVYLALAIVCALVLGISYLVSIPGTRSTAGISVREIKPILKDWRFMLVCLCVFLYCGAECSAWGWMSEYMDVNLGFTILKSSLAIGAFWLAITLGRMIVNRLSNRVSTRAFIGVLAAGAAVVTFASAFIRSGTLIWSVVVLMGLFYSSQWPLMVGQTARRHEQYSGTSIAVLVASGGIAMAVIPALLGVLTENFGVLISQILPAFFFVIIFIVYCFIARPEKA